MKLNVARTLCRSAANGPGERFVVWAQGCPLACPGCWNPDTWSFERRVLRDVDELAAEIVSVDGIEGVTFTGGEPFAQARALAQLGRRVKYRGLSVFVFTGYDLNELSSEPARELLAVADVLVAGRYIMAERTLDMPWRGSSCAVAAFVRYRTLRVRTSYGAKHALPKRCQNVAKIRVELVRVGPTWGAPNPAATPVYLG
jgi:anaerobic ribonucleoside-triphosphate reductase activating protein